MCANTFRLPSTALQMFVLFVTVLVRPYNSDTFFFWGGGGSFVFHKSSKRIALKIFEKENNQILERETLFHPLYSIS